MRVLLDTHTFLWFITDDAHLSPLARTTLEDAATERFLSVASLWEIAVKIAIGKLALRQPFAPYIPEQVRRNGITLLPIEIAHLAQITTLPPHHRDPFDRLLIAQAMVEHLPILGADQAFDAYPISRLW